jgi:hypothetical protein
LWLRKGVRRFEEDENDKKTRKKGGKKSMASETRRRAQKVKGKYARISKGTNAPVDLCTLHAERVRPRSTANRSRRTSDPFQLAGILCFFSVKTNTVSWMISSPHQNREEMVRETNFEEGTIT